MSMTNRQRLHKLADCLDEPTLANVVTVLLAMELYPVAEFTLEELIDELRHSNRALFTYGALQDHEALRSQARVLARAALQLAARCTPADQASR